MESSYITKLKATITQTNQESSPRRRIKRLHCYHQVNWTITGQDRMRIRYILVLTKLWEKFTRRYNVRSHIQTHLSDRPFGCQFCPKRFVRQHDLNRHVKGHIEARYSKCPCGKEFARLDALRKHQDRNICVGGNKMLLVNPQRKRELITLNNNCLKQIQWLRG